MQVLSIMKMQGDPDEILTKMADVEDVAARKAPEYGAISNTVVKTDDGIMILNLWGDEEGRHKLAADPEIQGRATEDRHAARLQGLRRPAVPNRRPVGN